MLWKSKGWKKEKDKHNVINLTGKISVNHLGTMSLEPTQMFKKSRLQKKSNKVQYWIIMVFWKILAVFQKKHCVDTSVLCFSSHKLLLKWSVYNDTSFQLFAFAYQLQFRVPELPFQVLSIKFLRNLQLKVSKRSSAKYNRTEVMCNKFTCMGIAFLKGLQIWLWVHRIIPQRKRTI